MTTLQSPLTDAHVQQFRDEGYFVLENVIPPEHLQNLRDECARFIAQKDAEMDALGVDVLGITHRGSRYFIGHPSQKSDKVRAFDWSELMAQICRATLGENAFLFSDQYVVKGAERGMKFGWHQDSGYVGYPHPPYLTCWCTLDDVNVANGSVNILPFSRAGSRDLVPHVKDPQTNDMVGYFGDDSGIPVIAPAGSIACFSSTVFHSSGSNTTDNMRRIYLAQFSATPILTDDGSRVRDLAEPVVQGGERVVDYPRVEN